MSQATPKDPDERARVRYVRAIQDIEEAIEIIERNENPEAVAEATRLVILGILQKFLPLAKEIGKRSGSQVQELIAGDFLFSEIELAALRRGVLFPKVRRKTKKAVHSMLVERDSKRLEDGMKKL